MFLSIIGEVAVTHRWCRYMSTHIQVDDTDLPSIDETIAAVSILGRILDEMRARLAASERAVASLERERLTLRSELRAIVDYAASRPVAPPSVRSKAREVRHTPLDDELVAIMKGIDASFERRAA